MNLGFSEVAFIVILALLLFGPKRLPEIGRQAGRAMAEFRRATGQLQAQINQVSQSIEMPLEARPLRRQSFFEVVTSVSGEPAPVAVHEENHV